MPLLTIKKIYMPHLSLHRNLHPKHSSLHLHECKSNPLIQYLAKSLLVPAAKTDEKNAITQSCTAANCCRRGVFFTSKVYTDKSTAAWIYYPLFSVLLSSSHTLLLASPHFVQPKAFRRIKKCMQMQQQNA
ncbi:hypothetical protein CHARACLAT_009856 [Characodon lateralis]|uniref:Uncharacterized protein n=1 Tax=Characodon lateralis TaxID=208331 RepID=A0ABU7D8G4_9TELE|nr:hypothetical protein [Characodon lateralis]